MNIKNLDCSIKKDSDLQKTYKLYMKNKYLQEFVNEEINEIRNKLELPGFRKGQVPVEVVKEKYNQSALYEAINKIVSKAISNILQDKKYDLISRPDIKFQNEINPQKDLDLHLLFFLKPDLSKFEFSKISVYKNELDFNEKDLQNEIQKFLEKNPKFEENKDLDYKVKNEDKVTISFEGFIKEGNIEIEGGKADKYDLIIGSKSFIDTFEDQIIGKKNQEEFQVNVKFPENYPQNKNLENKEAFFNVKIFSIYNPKKAELSEEFVKERGYESIEKFKESFGKNINSSYEDFEKNKLKEEIFKLAVKKAEISVPETILENEINFRIDKEKERKKDAEFDEKKYRKENKEKIELSLNIFYLVEAIIKRENISVSDEEFRNYILQYAFSAGVQDIQKFMKEMEDKKVKSQIQSTISENKVYDFLYNNITKKVYKISKEKFDKLISEYYENQRKNK